MNPKYDIHERIDLYLNGEMNQEAMREFEADLQTDENLLKTFKAQKVAHQIVVGDELLKLKAQMTKDLGGGHAGNSMGKTWAYILSGTLIVAVGIIIYLLNNGTPVAPKDELRDSLPMSGGSVPQGLSGNKDSVVLESPAQSENIKDDDSLKETSSFNENTKKAIPSDSIIHFSVQARGTCIQAHEGAIEIDINTIKSGKAPFLFSIAPDSNFHKEPVIYDLKAGKYNLYVKDSKQRVRKLNVKVEVPVINCGHIK
jgi:hypothetical protein